MSRDTVSVVVPAYNAERTIDETLRSARAQTHADLEILIVDDGSTDTTRDIIRRHVDEDGRLRLIEQSNMGVAAARNRGIAEATAELVAPLDADDLWHPEKIEKQVALMRASSPRVGLVYCWSATIDKNSRVVGIRHRPEAEGDVFSAMCKVNLVGNGSAALMRKKALVESGGYDPLLAARNAGGCEDLKVYLQIAEHYEFRVVRQHLTGYRRTPGNMSSDWTRMFRSFELVADEFEKRLPQTADDFYDGRNFMLRFLLIRAMKEGEISNSIAIARALFARDWRYCLSVFARAPLHIMANSLKTQMGASFPSIEKAKHFPLREGFLHGSSKL